MGFFSWKYSDTGKRMIIGKTKESYLLVPDEFHHIYGEYIKIENYNGYGMFNSHDVYDLVAIWNKEYIPQIYAKGFCPYNSVQYKDIAMYFHENGIEKTNEYAKIHCDDFDEKYWLRLIGIQIACYDEDNANLPYPIKIVEKPVPYNLAKPSVSDERQGCF